MQDKNRLRKLSQLRLQLDGLLKEFAKTVEEIFERSPMVKGNVYEIARKCGKPSCVCTRGQLHRSMVLTWSQQGKPRLLSIRKDQLAELRRKSQAYLRFRRSRAEVSVLCKKMLRVIDRIQALRLEEP